MGLVLLSVIFWYILWLGKSFYRDRPVRPAPRPWAAIRPRAVMHRSPAIRRRGPCTAARLSPQRLCTGPGRPPPVRPRLRAGQAPPPPVRHRRLRHRPAASVGAAPGSGSSPARCRAGVASAPIGRNRTAAGSSTRRGRRRSVGTASSVLRMASASARADDGSSSIATRAPAPRRRIDQVDVQGVVGWAWTGWSK